MTTCRTFFEKFKLLSLKMKAWHLNKRRRSWGARRRRSRRRREGEARRGERKPECKSCSLLIVADNSFYKEVRSLHESSVLPSLHHNNPYQMNVSKTVKKISAFFLFKKRNISMICLCSILQKVFFCPFL